MSVISAIPVSLSFQRYFILPPETLITYTIESPYVNLIMAMKIALKLNRSDQELKGACKFQIFG
jgi:hypothetical protein